MKIVTAVNAMIMNKDLISSVYKGPLEGVSEYFFVYNSKYKWSISYFQEGSEDTYYLNYYPENISIQDLAMITSWDDRQFMTYSTKTLGTKEAYETFQELYQIVKEKIYGIDSVLDKIIKDADPPF